MGVAVVFISIFKCVLYSNAGRLDGIKKKIEELILLSPLSVLLSLSLPYSFFSLSPPFAPILLCDFAYQNFAV
jgi:hypothetical protein